MKLRSNNGNSLAEFAVTMAIMATLATTAAPAFSRIGEGAKAKQNKRKNLLYFLYLQQQKLVK